MRIRDVDAIGEPEFSMAPLIDVVFQLLIFFMVVTTYGKNEKELGVELPNAESAQQPAKLPDEIVINILRDGRFSMGGHDVSIEDMRAQLADAARTNPHVPVTIRGDRLVTHENVVTVMDACGLAGLQNLAIGTLDR